jgi:acyl carrier protein
MSVTEQELLPIIFRCVEEINFLLPNEQKLSASPDTILVGEGGRLDSLALINLVVLLEEELQKVLSVTVVLTNEELIADGKGPYRTIAMLARFLADQI